MTPLYATLGGAGGGFALSFFVWPFRLFDSGVPVPPSAPNSEEAGGILDVTCRPGFVHLGGLFSQPSCVTQQTADAYHAQVSQLATNEALGRLAFTAVGAGLGYWLSTR